MNTEQQQQLDWQHPYAALTAKEKYCESNSPQLKKRNIQNRKRKEE